MKTIGFSNRERIEIGDKVDMFIEFLSKKLPQSDYESSEPEVDHQIDPAIKVVETALFDPDSREQMIRNVKEIKRGKQNENAMGVGN